MQTSGHVIAVNMNLKILVLCVVFFVEAKSECSDYITCLSELIHGFFGINPKNSTINDNFNETNETDLFEIKDFSNAHLYRILDKVSSIVKDNVTGDIIESRSKTAEFMNDKTKVLIKVFDFDKSDFENNAKIDDKEEQQVFVTSTNATEEMNVSTNTENPKDHLLTTDLIYQVNDMAESVVNFEDNLILPDNYFELEENNTDYPNIDYLEIYKDVTVENVVFEPTELPVISKDIEFGNEIDSNVIDVLDEKSNSLDKVDSGISDVFPWIVTIYIKNESKDDQYEYYCDGVLLNDRFVLTAGRCVNINNVTSSVEDLLIVLGKASLHSVGEHEMVRKVKTIITHENFTIYDGGAVNDLALMELDEPADLNSNAQGAVMIADDSDVELGATTAWGFTGELTPIIFDTEASKKCEANPEYENLFCAIYGNNIALCPSYGGLHVVKQTDRWYLRGIRTGDPERRGICLNRNVVFTELSNYKDWIDNVIAQ
ncbi:coagulation factor IX isoform X1 [Amyelois transitella]|uniref:coagulation factor IX isoform X1 n=1 Tax=Amyelois transitella TaxID=680683 RepID=UPI00298FA9BB|nr:coagulation factor IX isoform X1 [Amyelois transitella]